MKKRLEWFIVPCVATVFGSNALNLSAQESPKVKRNFNVVINQADDGETNSSALTKSIRDKVAKELAKSGIPEETKTRILKEVEDALKKAKIPTGKSKKSDEVISVEVEPSTGNPHALRLQEITGQIGGFTTQFMVDPKNDSFRIGIQCVQSEIEEGEEASENNGGLEVKAVFDDSPAKKAGIEEGDVLVTVDATKIMKISDLTNALQEAGKKEREVKIDAKRDEKVITLTVKPTKMNSSDIGLENIRLALPPGGFVVDGEMIKNIQGQVKRFAPEMEHQILSLKMDSAESMKKDLQELKLEIAELKKMIQEMAGKKSE